MGDEEELVPNAPAKIGSLRSKPRVVIRTGKTKLISVLPSQIGEVGTTRLRDAEVVVLREDADFGRYTHDIHGRVVPEDEAQRRFSMTLTATYNDSEIQRTPTPLANVTLSSVLACWGRFLGRPPPPREGELEVLNWKKHYR
ncbi:uncharacterized protein KRP23_13172 [Phytophthora ramorum]|uniref:uncharacterized protein n=1 Tax=Phytophthora ramorum TaxID=164328 RepID=UPI0030A00D8D|nr:hypothetical protein KRP23_13172 [Phytophthora ramorum]